MKKITIPLFLAVAAATAFDAASERIVIMHTNDTHSQIEPNAAGRGGVARRKVLIDSIRAAEPNTILVDAGDAVQGTVYFSLYGGEVESKMLKALGYDYAILGNHEFDNGVDSLAWYIKQSGVPYLSTNYDVTGSPLDGLLSPYSIVKRGGKKIGIIAINLQPDGMIDSAKSRGVEFLDVFKAANSTAWHLKHNEKVDYVVALTHVGYSLEDLPDDLDIAAKSEDIDVVIGGHSHTVVKPGTEMALRTNEDGRPVVVAQTGSLGENLGLVIIDTDKGTVASELIPVDSRLDGRVDPAIETIIAPYRHGVDSLKSIVVGKNTQAFERKDEGLLNFVADFARWEGRRLNNGKQVDLAIVNRGGIRNGLGKGNVTRGIIMEILPFDNRVELLDIKGEDLIKALVTAAETRRVGFDRPVVVELDDDRHEATIDGVEIDPDKQYTIATIDYLANGGDYMTPLKAGIVKAVSSNKMNLDVLDYIKTLKKHTINPSLAPRMTVKK